MTTTPLQKIVSRPFQREADFWRVRDLLIETYPITPPGFNWDVRRWDGQRFHRADIHLNPEWERRVRLWETEDRRLVGVVHPEDPGSLFLELHPDYRDLEAEMIAWGEEHLAETSDGKRQIDIFVHEYDTLRRHLLEVGDYERTVSGGILRRMRFGS